MTCSFEAKLGNIKVLAKYETPFLKVRVSSRNVLFIEKLNVQICCGYLPFLIRVFLYGISLGDVFLQNVLKEVCICMTYLESFGGV